MKSSLILEDVIDRIDRRYENVFEQNISDSNLAKYECLFSERGRGFYKAANLIIGEIEENFNQYNAEMMPAALSLYRQSCELYLKSMRLVLVREVSSKYQFARSHNLAELWTPIQEFLSSVGLSFDDGQLHYRVARFIQEFNDIDERGDRFRYPDSRSSTAQNELGGNIFYLKLAAAEVDLLCFGFSELVAALRSGDG